MTNRQPSDLRCRIPFLAVLVIAILVPRVNWAQLKIAPLKYPVGPQTENVWIPFASSHPPSAETNPTIKRVVVVIHSANYDALQSYEYVRAAAQIANVSRETLMIAPQLFEPSAVPGDVAEGMLYWTESPFLGSARAAIGPDEQEVSLSAYEVLDTMLAQLADRAVFPKLTDIVLTGHSSGARLVQRYALVGRFEPPQGIQCRFVVSAPSSFAYATPERRTSAAEMKFGVPDGKTIAICPEYNRWGAGLKKPYGYFKESNPEAVAERYASRRVYYLCGEKDTDPDAKSLSRTCASMLQGRNRRERLETYYAYLQHTYGDGIVERQKMAIVPGVGHSGRGNMTSTIGQRFLFSDMP